MAMRTTNVRLQLFVPFQVYNGILLDHVMPSEYTTLSIYPLHLHTLTYGLIVNK